MPNLRPLRQFVVLFALVRTCVWLQQTDDDTPLLFSMVPLVVALLLSFTRTRAHWAPRMALPVIAYHVVLLLPGTANHMFLELYIVALLSIIDGDNDVDGQRLATNTLCILSGLVLFHSGLQKLTYGYYVNGDFLAFMVASQERFAGLFTWLLSPDDVARLTSYDMLRTGSGPFRVLSPRFVVVSNLVWIVEITLPAMMLFARTRVPAACAAIAFVLAIQLGAREVGFAALMVHLLLLFLPSGLMRPVSFAFGACLIALAAAALLGLPVYEWVHL